ncbi:MAG: leucine-rich repeat protein [Ruminiclostridium sp.]|nr:leucine-rich repeat protein [Ruminiclostridium sp.]
MKKLLLGIATFITATILCVVAAGAEVCGDYEYIVRDDGTAEIVQYRGYSEKEHVIPSELDGKKVTCIGESAFSIAQHLVSVTIPDSVTTIDDYAFQGCFQLESVAISGSVKTIGDYAFCECTSLVSITIPQGVTDIGDNAFRSCTALKSADISASVISIGSDVFTECISLEEILVDSANKNYASVDGVFFNKNMTELITYPSDKTDTSYIVPSTVTKLGNYAFSDCSSILSVTLPEGLTHIGDFAFAWCHRLETITIPEKVTSIGKAPFYWCFFLTDVNADEDNESFASVDGVLFNKDMTEIIVYPAGKMDPSYVIPDGVEIIGEYAFSDVREIESVTIPEGVKSIGDYAFRGCFSITSMTLPDGIKSIGGHAFEDCEGLVSINLPDSVRSIGSYCFDCCYVLETVNIPQGVTTIEEFTFGQCKELKSIVIPDSVTSIGAYSFNNCHDLKSVVIPESVTSIGDHAFSECFFLESITAPESVTAIDDDVFYHCVKAVVSCYKNSAIHKYVIDNEISYTLLTRVAVSDLTSPSKSATAIRLNWTADSSATGYIIEQYIDGSWVQIADITDSSTTTYKVTELVPGTAYKFRMRAYDEDAEGKNTEALTESTLMTAVKGFTSPSKSTTAIRLNWKMNAYADGYLIDQYTNDGWVQIADITDGATTTYKVTGLKSGTAYKFRMKAYSVTENDEIILGSKTATLTANTQASSVKGFALKSRSSAALRLKWSKNTAVDGYVIEQMIDGEWTEIADIDSYKTTEYKVTGLAAATSYEFRMKSYAITKYGEKTYSAYTSVLTKTTSPSAVSGFRVKSKSDKAIRLAWTPNEAVDGYSIEMYIDGEWTFYSEASVIATELKVTGLESATEYQFRIRAYVLADDTVLYSGYKTISGMTL